MNTVKITITIKRDVLERLDRLIEKEQLPSRSGTIQEAVGEMLDRRDRNRLAKECAKVRVKEERQLAEEGMAADIQQWPEY
jgi:metal-responsive CopG/Arc/MetJ family transcriptional regulator